MESNAAQGSTSYNLNGEAKCPFSGTALRRSAGAGSQNRDWWPNQLKLSILRQHSNLSNPMGEKFNYGEAFKSLDLAVLKISNFKFRKK